MAVDELWISRIFKNMCFLSTIHPQVITIEMHSYSQDNHMFILRFIRLSIENLTIITIIRFIY